MCLSVFGDLWVGGGNGANGNANRVCAVPEFVHVEVEIHSDNRDKREESKQCGGLARDVSMLVGHVIEAVHSLGEDVEWVEQAITPDEVKSGDEESNHLIIEVLGGTCACR